MTDLTEIERNADYEARHGHRALIEKLEARLANVGAQCWEQMERAEKAEARVAELGRLIERKYFTGWNAAIRAAANACSEITTTGRPHGPKGTKAAIYALLREGGSDDQ